MTYIATSGKTPTGEVVSLPVSGRAAGTATPLGAGGSWSSGWIYVDQYIGVSTTLYSDQPGTYVLDYSEDASTMGAMPSITISYTQVGQSRKGSFSPSAKYVRFTYTNGATAQTKFIFNIDLNDTQTQTSSETLNAAGADTRTAMWTKSRIETKTSDGTNDYAPVYRTGNSLNVNVTNQSQVQPSNSVVTSVTTTTSSTQVLAANTARKGAMFTSTSGTILIKLGATASATSYTVRLVTNGMYELPSPVYTGVVTAIGAGTLLVTELS